MKNPESADAIFDRDESAFFNSFSEEDLKFKDPSGRTLLASAIIENLPNVIDFLLKFEEVITISDKKGMQPLHLCAVKNDIRTTKLLLVKEIDIDVRDYFGNTPLWRATFNSNYELIRILVELGADPDAKNNNDISPLDFAKEVEDEQLILALTGRSLSTEN